MQRRVVEETNNPTFQIAVRGAILCQIMQSVNVETRKSYRRYLVQTKVWRLGPLRIPVEMCIPIGVEAAHAGPVDYF
jgi:hypothetical protein